MARPRLDESERRARTVGVWDTSSSMGSWERSRDGGRGELIRC